MPNATVLKHFVKRLEEVKKERIAAVCKKFPVKDYEFKPWLEEGAGKLRSEADIRKLATSNACYGSLALHQLFDFTDVTGTIKAANEVNQKKRDAACKEINDTVQKLIDKAYFSDDSDELVDLLESFRRA